MNTMDEAISVCKFLDWDTNFFGRRIARSTVNTLSASVLAQINAWSRANQIDCLYFLADAGDPQTVRLAEENGFQLVEVRLIFERSLQGWEREARTTTNENVIVRPSLPEDVPALKEIAGNSYVNSRFFFDSHFDKKQWEAFYQYWIEKSVLGGADLALTAEMDGEIVGYITGLVDRETNEGIYELTGVKTSARRAGIGQELFRCGVDWFVRHDIPTISVSTQGRNIPTQRMIQRFGFLTRKCELYYHKWFNE